MGVGPELSNSATSDFGEIYSIYVNLTGEHNGLAPESLGGYLRGIGVAAAPFQILKKKKWFGCNALTQEDLHQSN